MSGNLPITSSSDTQSSKIIENNITPDVYETIKRPKVTKNYNNPSTSFNVATNRGTTPNPTNRAVRVTANPTLVPNMAANAIYNPTMTSALVKTNVYATDMLTDSEISSETFNFASISPLSSEVESEESIEDKFLMNLTTDSDSVDILDAEVNSPFNEDIEVFQTSFQDADGNIPSDSKTNLFYEDVDINTASPLNIVNSEYNATSEIFEDVIANLTPEALTLTVNKVRKTKDVDLDEFIIEPCHSSVTIDSGTSSFIDQSAIKPKVADTNLKLTTYNNPRRFDAISGFSQSYMPYKPVSSIHLKSETESIATLTGTQPAVTNNTSENIPNTIVSSEVKNPNSIPASMNLPATFNQSQRVDLQMPHKSPAIENSQLTNRIQKSINSTSVSSQAQLRTKLDNFQPKLKNPPNKNYQAEVKNSPKSNQNQIPVYNLPSTSKQIVPTMDNPALVNTFLLRAKNLPMLTASQTLSNIRVRSISQTGKHTPNEDMSIATTSTFRQSTDLDSTFEPDSSETGPSKQVRFSDQSTSDYYDPKPS